MKVTSLSGPQVLRVAALHTLRPSPRPTSQVFHRDLAVFLAVFLAAWEPFSLKITSCVVNLTLDHFGPFIGCISETAQYTIRCVRGTIEDTSLASIHTYLISAIVE
jgi:hypothetical protein